MRFNRLVEDDLTMMEIKTIKCHLKGRTTTYAKQCWCEFLEYPEETYDRSAGVRMGAILTTYCGWVSTKIRIRRGNERHWLMSAPDLPERAQAAPESDFADILG